MTPQHFLAILGAELRKLFRHPAGRLGLVLAVLIGIAGPLGILWVGSSDAIVNGQPISETLDYSAPQGIIWSLRMRDFSHVMRLFVVALAASSLAGELGARTMREALLRPVPRWIVPVAKFGALAAYVFANGLLTWLASSAAGAVLLGVSGHWSDAAWGMTYSLVGDLAVVAVTLLVAVLTRSVAGSIVIVVVLAVMNWFTRAAMWMVETVLLQAEQTTYAEALGMVRPWTPTYAIDGWINYIVPYLGLGTDWYKPLITALLCTAVCVALTSLRLSRIDVH
ncbi:MAG: hypothetical protein EP330_09455 [Deltaproteobacteria bacterium]|nr:MAG: hypothetical protein EP330_09455 [Deltaproteobacteria bacterium]